MVAESRIRTFVRKYPPAGNMLRLLSPDGDTATVLEEWSKSVVQDAEQAVIEQVVEACDEAAEDAGGEAQLALCWFDVNGGLLCTKKLKQKPTTAHLVRAQGDDGELMPTSTAGQHAEMSGALLQKFAGITLVNNATIINHLTKHIERLEAELARYRDREREVVDLERAVMSEASDGKHANSEALDVLKGEALSEVVRLLGKHADTAVPAFLKFLKAGAPTNGRGAKLPSAES